MIPTFRQLKHVGVYNLPLTSELLRRICELPQLELLDLGGEKMRLRGADVASLEKVPHLKTLIVGHAGSGTEVADDWWEPMSKLTNLTELYLYGANVSEARVAELHAALPHCRIITDHETIEPEAATEHK
jgi:hypothetical protein